MMIVFVTASIRAGRAVKTLAPAPSKIKRNSFSGGVLFPLLVLPATPAQTKTSIPRKSNVPFTRILSPLSKVSLRMKLYWLSASFWSRSRNSFVSRTSPCFADSTSQSRWTILLVRDTATINFGVRFSFTSSDAAIT